MSDKSVMAKEEFQQKVAETEQAIAYDRQCRSHDAEEYHKKHQFLMKYRDTNKSVSNQLFHDVMIFFGEF